MLKLRGGFNRSLSGIHAEGQGFWKAVLQAAYPRKGVGWLLSKVSHSGRIWGAAVALPGVEQSLGGTKEVVPADR